MDRLHLSNYECRSQRTDNISYRAQSSRNGGWSADLERQLQMPHSGPEQTKPDTQQFGSGLNNNNNNIRMQNIDLERQLQLPMEMAPKRTDPQGSGQTPMQTSPQSQGPQCCYGAQCQDNSAEHRAYFRHPGDFRQDTNFHPFLINQNYQTPLVDTSLTRCGVSTRYKENKN